MDATNNHLDVMQVDLAVIRNFILSGQCASQPATTRLVLSVSTQPALPASSLAFSTPAGDGAPTLVGVPIHRISFPPSPSPLPPWLAGSSQASSLSWLRIAPLGYPHAPDVLYGGIDGSLFPSDVGALLGAASVPFDAHPRDEAPAQTTPRFYKLEFPGCPMLLQVGVLDL
jgi:hypothetical protein